MFPSNQVRLMNAINNDTHPQEQINGCHMVTG